MFVYFIQYSDHVRDLGVIVDSTLKFEQHISAVVHKAHTRANLILKCFSSRIYIYRWPKKSKPL